MFTMFSCGISSDVEADWQDFLQQKVTASGGSLYEETNIKMQEHVMLFLVSILSVLADQLWDCGGGKNLVNMTQIKWIYFWNLSVLVSLVSFPGFSETQTELPRVNSAGEPSSAAALTQHFHHTFTLMFSFEGDIKNI